MPLFTIWRDKSVVDDQKVIELRDLLLTIGATTLRVEPQEVEIRICDIGHLDINYMPIGIEIDTGTGKNCWRLDDRVRLAKSIAQQIVEAKVLPSEWLGPEKSYVWIRICESSFVPIGSPEHAR